MLFVLIVSLQDSAKKLLHHLITQCLVVFYHTIDDIVALTDGFKMSFSAFYFGLPNTSKLSCIF